MFNNFKAKFDAILKLALPARLHHFIRSVYFAWRNLCHGFYLRTLDSSEGYFEVRYPHVDFAPEIYLNLENYSEFRVFRKGPSKAEMITLKNHLSRGDVFYDIGAFVGYFTVPASHLVGKSGSVVAIEPFKKSLESLEKTLDRNNITNVQTLCCALDRQNGSTPFHLSDDPGTHSIQKKNRTCFFSETTARPGRPDGFPARPSIR